MSVFISKEILIFILNLLSKTLVCNWFFPIRTKHCVCFTWSSLTVGKNCAIKTANDFLYWVSTHVINICLWTVLCNNFVVAAFNQMYSIWNFYNLGLLSINLHHFQQARLPLARIPFSKVVKYERQHGFWRLMKKNQLQQSTLV